MSSFRLPQIPGRQSGAEAADAALRHELEAEQSLTLGRTGRRAQTALQALEAHQEGREAVLKAAVDAVWSLFVQREVLGLRDRAAVIAEYRIPREVMNRLGGG